MFGSRLKTWMENYIGRPRKKEVQKEKPKGNDGGGVILESSESLACSDTGISFSSQQVLSSSATDNKEGYSTTTMESERSGITHCHTAVSLPSPESAYSTGYSTDGASPGETGPPEYYINIRTGKHYFPSPAPTPTSPQPNAAFLQLHSANQRPSTSFLPEDSSRLSNTARPPRIDGESSPSENIHAKSPVRTLKRFSNGGFPPHLDSSRSRKALSASVPSYFEILNFSKSPCKKSSSKSQLTPIKLFLKSPRHEKGTIKAEVDKPAGLVSKKKQSSAGKPKKWYKQPFQKFGHRRTDSCDETAAKNQVKREEEIHLEKNFRYLLGQENSASPRQRNRIKTNPWLPTEPMSSQNFHNLHVDFSPSLTWNRSCSSTPLQNRKTSEPDPLHFRAKQSSEKIEESKNQPNKFEKAGNRHAGEKLGTEPSDHSEEDLTLNEVMGTFNESYVYEKETDILSDSDPTDCEDYGTDSEAENGGDERDSHDDELDFIDNGSVYESDDNFPQNTGKCTYHDVRMKKNSFLHKSERRKFRKESECRKNSRKEQDSKIRREKRRLIRKSSKQEDEERRKIFDEKIKPKVEIDENVGGLNLGRVLVQRMLTAKNVSKSAEGTPVTGRRQNATEGLRETRGGNQKAAEKKAEVILIDFEADNRYNELIREAENIFESLRNGPVTANGKENVVSGREEKTSERSLPSADFSKDAKAGPKEPAPAPTTRKCPKELGLKLSMETPRRLKRLDFGTSEKSNFKTRSSAHSPLDPLGPTLRNFAVFDPDASADAKVSTSSSEDSEPGKQSEKNGCAGRRSGVPESPVVPIAFQSVDLGKAFASYCPQSEPVKRKIYSCSKTYDKLAKRFENKPAIFEETKNGKAGSPSLETRDRGSRSGFPRTDGDRTLRGGLRNPVFATGRRPGTENTRRRSPLSDVIR